MSVNGREHGPFAVRAEAIYSAIEAAHLASRKTSIHTRVLVVRGPQRAARIVRTSRTDGFPPRHIG